MATKITDEQRQALRQFSGGPIRVEDEQSRKEYVLVDAELHDRAMQALRERENVAAIQAGLDAADQGKAAPLSEVDARIRDKLGFSARG